MHFFMLKFHHPFLPKHIHKLIHFIMLRIIVMTMIDSDRGNIGTCSFMVNTTGYSFVFNEDLQVLLFGLLALFFGYF